jgi:hypothetical protein
MHIDLGGGWWVLIWVFGWAAWSYVEDREHNKKRLAVYDLIHKERLHAMDKGLPAPELPPYQIDEPEAPQRESLPWRSLAGWGIVCAVTGIGSALAIWMLNNNTARSYWPLGTIPLWVGLGLLACSWLFRRTAARR